MEILERLSSPTHVALDRQTSSQQRDCQDRYLDALDLSVDVPNVIHVTGTKGKGSTCAMVESMLRISGYKTGLFTSPHLHHPKERIKIQGKPVDEAVLWDTVRRTYDRLMTVRGVPFPGYFRFMAFVALEIFRASLVNVVILEVGIGGRFDPTNLVRCPVVCGVASVGMDHQSLLGDTLSKIAWEKGGILKHGAAAWTVPQKEEVMEVLRECAMDQSIQLNIARSEDYNNWDDIQGGRISGYQLENAALAVSLASAFERYALKKSIHPSNSVPVQQRLASLKRQTIPDAYCKGLASLEWKGRAQVIHQPQRLRPGLNITPAASRLLSFYLDGAHTPESMDACADWIVGKWDRNDSLDFVLFNCHRLKDPALLLERLYDRLRLHRTLPDGIFFAPMTKERASLLPISTSMQPLEWQSHQLEAWNAIIQQANPVPRLNSPDWLSALDGHVLPPVSIDRHGTIPGHVFRSLKSGIEWFGRTTAMHKGRIPVRVLVTGSLYFVSDVLEWVDHR